MTWFFLALIACNGDENTGKDSVVGNDWVDDDGDGFLSTVDCDDTNADIHPAAVDAAGDGVDQDCSGADGSASTLVDADGDGATSMVDCDDSDNSRYPGAPDAAGDGIDQNCDGNDGSSSGIVDADGDGATSTVDCDDNDNRKHPGATDIPGDGIDQDCDGSDASPSADADADGDGWASETFGGPDCNDSNAAINPAAKETVGDNLDSDCDGADYGVSGLKTGDLVVTEIMYDPDMVDDGDGEWFEVYNATAHTINLLDLVVSDDVLYGAADVFTVDENLIVAAGARLVFGVNGDTTLNGGITVQYDYAGRGVNLGNGGDDIFLGIQNGASVTTIDSVSYDELSGWPIAKGVSIELKDTAITAAANDSANNWCLATGKAGNTTDKGSPGAASSGC